MSSDKNRSIWIIMSQISSYSIVLIRCPWIEETQS